MGHSFKQLRSVFAAAESLLAARDCGMLTEEEWDGLARAVDPPTLVPDGATQRFLYDPAEGLVRLIEKNGSVLTRQSAIPDALTAIAEFAESRVRSTFFIEGARRDASFQFDRSGGEVACEFLIHLGLASRQPDGSFAPTPSPAGDSIVVKALEAMNVLPRS